MAKTVNKTQAKHKAQDLIMSHIARICYEDEYEDFVKEVANGENERADAVLMEQMNRIAKLFGYKEAWFG